MFITDDGNSVSEIRICLKIKVNHFEDLDFLHFIIKYL